MKNFELGKIYYSRKNQTDKCIRIIFDEKIDDNYYIGRRSFYGSYFKSGYIQTFTTNDIEFYFEDGGGEIITADEAMTDKEIFYLFEAHLKPYGEYFEYLRYAKQSYLDDSFEDNVEYECVTFKHLIETNGLDWCMDILLKHMYELEKYDKNLDANAEYAAYKKIIEIYF